MNAVLEYHGWLVLSLGFAFIYTPVPFILKSFYDFPHIHLHLLDYMPLYSLFRPVKRVFHWITFPFRVFLLQRFDCTHFPASRFVS